VNGRHPVEVCQLFENTGQPSGTKIRPSAFASFQNASDPSAFFEALDVKGWVGSGVGQGNRFLRGYCSAMAKIVIICSIFMNSSSRQNGEGGRDSRP